METAESDMAVSSSDIGPLAGDGGWAAAGGSPLPQRTAADGGSSSAAGDDAAQFDFFTRLYKVEPCLLRVPHDWAQCPFAHRQGGERSARRDLRLHAYQSVPCVYAKQRQPCPNGDLCPSAHSLTEYWLHPARFRTERCQFGSACKRPVCFFAHTAEQLRPLDASLPPAELCWQTGSSLTFGRTRRTPARPAAAGPAAPAVPAAAVAPPVQLSPFDPHTRGAPFDIGSLVAALPASADDLLAGATLLAPVRQPHQQQHQLQQQQQQQRRPPHHQQQQQRRPPPRAEQQQAGAAGPLMMGLGGAAPLGLITDPAIAALLAASHQQQQLMAAHAAAGAVPGAAFWGLPGAAAAGGGGLHAEAAAVWQGLSQPQQQQHGVCGGQQPSWAANGRQPSGAAALPAGGGAAAVCGPQQVVYMLLGGHQPAGPLQGHMAASQPPALAPPRP